MHRFSINVTFFILIFLQTASIRAENFSIIQGKITTVTGIPISSAKVNLESNRYLYEITTDAQGNYKIGVSADIYKISVDKWIGNLRYGEEERFSPSDCKLYFRDTLRANVSLKKGETNTINFILIESGCVDWQKGEEFGSGSFTIISDSFLLPKVEYDTLFRFETQDEFQNFFNMIIQYGFREEKGDTTIYQLPVYKKAKTLFANPFPGVVITYNHKTIYANKVFVNKKQRVVRAEGNIILEENGKQILAKEINISISNREPVFKMKW